VFSFFAVAAFAMDADFRINVIKTGKGAAMVVKNQ
jgi:hypothetical protein